MLLTKESIENLWDAFAELYGNLFINKYGVEDSGMWSDILGDLTVSEIEYGVNKIKGAQTEGKFDEFPPNPIQFRTLCLGHDLENNIPSTAEAFREAVNNIGRFSNPRWSDKAVQATAYKLATELEEEDVHIIYPKFKALYELACRHLKHDKKPILIEQPKQITKKTNQSVGETHLGNLYQILGTK